MIQPDNRLKTPRAQLLTDEELAELCAPWEAFSLQNRATLRGAAQAVVDAVDWNHDNKPLPLKYTVPWGEITELRRVLDAERGGG